MLSVSLPIQNQGENTIHGNTSDTCSVTLWRNVMLLTENSEAVQRWAEISLFKNVQIENDF